MDNNPYKSANQLLSYHRSNAIKENGSLFKYFLLQMEDEYKNISEFTMVNTFKRLQHIYLIIETGGTPS